MADPAAALTITPERVPVRFGMIPTSVEEGWRLAQMLAKSDLVPKGFRNKPEDVIVAMQLGAEVGLPPMQSLQSIAVINGRPGIWGDGLLALVIASPVYQDHDEYFLVGPNAEQRSGLRAEELKSDLTLAVCTFLRRGKATPVTRYFSVAQAKRAGLFGKEGPWQQYPDRMLAMRARSFAARDAFPDVLRGIRAAEELADVAELPAAGLAAAPGPARVKRLSEAPLSAAPAPPETPTDVRLTPMILGPLFVRDIERLASGMGTCATLSDGTTLFFDDDVDATELATFVRTDHRLTFVVDHAGPWPDGAKCWHLVSFTLAD